MARVASQLIGDVEKSDELLHDALTRAYNVVKPRVVLVSHVVRTTGQMLLSHTLGYFREANPHVVVIVDGSQAAGNVVVDRDILSLCDFYISSGHKWLGGTPTSGFVWHDKPGRWRIDDYAQSVARGQQQAGGSGNPAAWLSLTASIVEMLGGQASESLATIANNNQRLATFFCEQIADLPSVRFLTPRASAGTPNGIVVLTFQQPIDETIEEALAEYRYSVIRREQVRWRATPAPRFLLDWRQGYPVLEHADEYTDMWTQRAHRFCFHYWHDEDDVVSLAEAIRSHVLASPSAVI
jgi:selenocysteine lyase/cysteine desulfurase